MLAFLESLCGALLARDAEAIRRLLAHPLAHALPRAVRDEARTVANGTAWGYTAPLQAMHLYHQTAHLLGACADPATRRGEVVGPTPSQPAPRGTQIELPLGRAAVH